MYGECNQECQVDNEESLKWNQNFDGFVQGRCNLIANALRVTSFLQ